MRLTITIEIRREPKSEPARPLAGPSSHLGGSHAPAPRQPIGFAPLRRGRPTMTDEARRGD